MKKKDKPSKSDLTHLAEAKLSEHKKRVSSVAAEANGQHLIQELEVHQIELEMQNEKLIQARAEAESAYRQFTDLYDFAPVGYLTLGRDGTIRQVNAAGVNLFGIERTKMIDRRLGLFVSAESRIVLGDFLKILDSGKGKDTCELLLKKKEDKQIWVRMEASCFEGGLESRALMIDITERKQAEKALQESETRFRTILQDIQNIAVQGFAADGTTQYWNTASEKLYGYSAKEAIGKNLLDLIIPPQMRDEVRQAIKQMSDSGHPIPAAELALMRKDGSLVSVFSSHAIVTVPGHAPELFCLNVDLTERIQAEEALFKSENKYRTMFENMSQGAFYQQADGTLVDVNASALEILGLDREQFLGKTSYAPQWKVFTENGDNLPAEQHPSMLALKTGQVIRNAIIGVYNPRREGNVWININAIPQFKPNEDKPYQVFVTLEDITERKQAEQRLRQSEERFRMLFDKAPLGYQALDAEGRFLDVNQTWLNTLGYAREEVIGKWFGEFLSGDYADAFRKRFPIFKAAGQIHSEFEMLHKNGSRHWIAFEGRIGYEINGAFKQTHCILQDITDRKRIENELIQSEEKFRSMFDQSPVGSVMVGLDKCFIESNSAFCNFLGYTEQELIGKTITDVTHPEDKLIGMNELKQLAEGKIGSYTSQKRYLRKDGTIVWGEISIRLIRDANQKPLFFLPIIQDITQRKQAEEALQESQEKFQAIANYTVDWESWFGLDGKYLWTNPAVEEITGYFEHEVLANPDFISTIIIDEDRPMFIERFQEALRGDRKKNLEFRYFHKNKGLRWLGLSWQPIYDAQGGPLGTRVSARDITERKQMENALRDSQARNRALVGAIPDLLFVQDRAGVYIDYHANNPQLLIAQPEVFLGHTAWEVMPPEQAQAIQHKFDLAFETGEIQALEYVLELADRRHYFEARINAYDQDRVLIIIRDVTERKLAETELKYMKESLEAANIELKAALTREKEFSLIDGLTGINNRRHLYELADHEFEVAVRYHQPLAVMMIDIDHFKQVNDTFGHAAGDQMLQRVTQTAKAELRSSDVFGRYGGEEFVIILPMTNAEQAYPLAERIREIASAIRLPTENGVAQVTLSIGIVEMGNGAQAKSVEDLIRHADEAMYAAKQAGRNCTEMGHL